MNLRLTKALLYQLSYDGVLHSLSYRFLAQVVRVLTRSTAVVVSHRKTETKKD